MKKSRARIRIPVHLALAAVLLSPISALAQNKADKDVAAKLKGLDAYMAKALKDWNCPGIGVAVVVGDQLVFSKGYGYRDYGKKLPYTPTTLHQIASNSKLFTAVASGILVDDRFETPDDERYGRWSVNFATNPQGDIDKASMSLDEAEATFTRRPTPPPPDVLKKIAGTYVSPTGFPFDVALKEDGSLTVVRPGGPDQKLVPYKNLKFRIPEFSDVVIEFVMENGQVTAMTQRDASGEYRFKKKTP